MVGKEVTKVGILDFNLRRMPEKQIADFGIPDDMVPLVGDLRQYPLKISEFLPDDTLWFSSDQPWFFRSVMGNSERLKRFKENDILILSGSGMSAHKYSKGDYSSLEAEDVEHLKKTEEMIRESLVAGKDFLGICFGGQFGINALGGELGRLYDNQYGNTITEAGYLEHELTEEGKKDEVFKDVSDRFYAAHFHNDYVSVLPPLGAKIKAGDKEIEVVRSEVIAVRHGYLDRDGLKEPDKAFIHAAVVEFDNGAKFYHTQFHPEMGTRRRSNFFARRVYDYLAQEEEMGKDYATRAIVLPKNADFSTPSVITNFVELGKKRLELETLQLLCTAFLGQQADFVEQARKYSIE